MPRLSRLLAAAILAVVLPAVVLSQTRSVIAAHGLAMVMATMAWEVLVAGGWVISKIATVPVTRRFEELGNALDRALGLRMSPYGRRYRQWVLDSRRFLESKGLATVGDFTPELDEVFVDVGLVRSAPHKITPGILPDAAPLNTGNRQSIWEFLTTQGPPVVLAVIGAPGSGKTTLLSHTARHVARTPDQRRRPIPVLLQLRDHAAQVAADPNLTLPQLLRDVVPRLATAEPTGWWENRLNRGKCVVLFDGLDEVGNADERQEIGNWVNRQISVYPDNDYVITSRPHGYRTAVIDSAEVLQVRPFTPEQVRQFLSGWYLAVERRATGSAAKEVEDTAREAANDLLDRLAATPALYDLTVNPLLLAMIANVHRYRGSLPGSRADLYGEMCQVMLWRRQEAKKLAVELPGPSKERILASLAYHMMNQPVRDLARGPVLDVIRPGLRRLSTAMTPESFLSDVVTNGLLIERERGLYAYAHLTFQEYLAAKHIKDHDLGHQLTETVEDGWWRETTLLYVAGADGDAIVRACLDSGSSAAVSLAFECLETGAELAPELRRSLNAILSEAFRPDVDSDRRYLAAQVLAARHLRQVVPTSTGTLICPRPIPTSLYWLFLQEGGVPSLEAPCPADLSESRPVTGVWRTDAMDFVAWLNRATNRSGEQPHRLPTMHELQDLATKPGPAAHLASAVRTAWTMERDGKVPRLWTASGGWSPRELRMEELISAASRDVARFALLPRLQQPAVVQLVRALAGESSQSLDRALQVSEIFSRARSKLNDPELFGPVRGLIATLTRDLKRECAIAEQIDATLSVSDGTTINAQLASALADSISRYGSEPLSAALARTSSLDRELTIASHSSHDFGLRHANGYARSIHRALTRAAARLAEIAAAGDVALPESAIVPALALDLAPARDARGDVPAVLTTVMGGAITRAFLAATQETDEPSRVRAFASALISATHLSGGERLVVSLEGAAQNLRRAADYFERRASSSYPRPATIAARLARYAEPLLTRRKPLGAGAAGLARLPALALATEAERSGPEEISDCCRTVAAATTLLAIRARRPDSLEGIILAKA